MSPQKTGTARAKAALSGLHRRHYALNMRRACRLVKQTRSMQYYRSVKDARHDLRARMHEIARTRIRYGYRRIHILLKRDGWKLGRNQAYRIYAEEQNPVTVASILPAMSAFRRQCAATSVRMRAPCSDCGGGSDLLDRVESYFVLYRSPFIMIDPQLALQTHLPLEEAASCKSLNAIVRCQFRGAIVSFA